jgi:Rod binding domain-containing protein
MNTPAVSALTQSADLAKDQAKAGRMRSLTAGPAPTAAQIDKTAQDFEAMFLSSMLQPMFAELKLGEGRFGGGHGESMFQSMLVDEYAKSIAKAGGLGIAQSVKAQMLRQQEVQS